MDFSDFFNETTGFEPYPYQKRLAEIEEYPSLLNIPTGLGKTAAIVTTWIWRRKFHDDQTIREGTPRRLIYCLPTRVLVEQVRDNILLWLKNANLLGGEIKTISTNEKEVVESYKPSWVDGNKISVTTLMGGEEDYNWDIYPERDSIIIGTQDMLLSRALNRGYGMNRYKWPVHFGLLNNDSLWVFDEVQLMGSGIKTSVQLEAFRRYYGVIKKTQTIWMSATVNVNWLDSVDFKDEMVYPQELKLSDDDYSNEEIIKVVKSPKKLNKITINEYDFKELVGKVLNEHVSGTRTLVIFNTVDRSRTFFTELKMELENRHSTATPLLIHSQFRKNDRSIILKSLLEKPGSGGTIVVSTQVIEAGIDISSKTLFTELAPLSSMVQRFGRCNRKGLDSGAKIFWIDILSTKNDKFILPYKKELLEESQNFLVKKDTKDITSEDFSKINEIDEDITIIRPKDILELFNTDTDLTGEDIDISRFIRNDNSTNVQVFWRDFKNDDQYINEPFPKSNELCSAPIQDVKALVKKKNEVLFAWDFFEGMWVKLQDPNNIFPGRMIMLKALSGHYSKTEGWNPDLKEKVDCTLYNIKEKGEGYSSNDSSQEEWQTIEEHTKRVVDCARVINYAINMPSKFSNWIESGARWHDAGKAHEAFQALINKDNAPIKGQCLWAKAPADSWRKGRLPKHQMGNEVLRKHFRHELVSGLLAIMNKQEDVVAFLAMAHHGKVRTAIRSMPDEYVPEKNDIRYACGVWDGDRIPSIVLGERICSAEATINLSIMELGLIKNAKSWLNRILDLIHDPNIGIFRLGYMEAIVRAADRRASGGI